MREGWKVSKLGTLCSVRRDSGIHNDMNYIGLEHISSGTGRLLSLADTSSVIGTTNLFKEGDVLYGKLRPYLKKVIVADCEGCCSTEILPIRCGDSIHPDFLKYWFLEDGLTDKINATCGGCRMPRANMRDVFEFELAFPSLTEQQRIVDILDQEFAKIDALKVNAEKSLQAAKDLFLQMIAHTFANPSWSWKRIGDVFDTGAGGTPLKTYQEYYENGDIPWLRSGEVCKKYITETEMFITQLGMDNSSAKMFPENTVVVAMYGATAGQVGILHLETTTNQAVCGIFPNDDYVPEFIYYSLLNSKKELVAQAIGNAQPNISQIKIKNTSIPVISRKEQEEVVSCLDNLNEKCNTLQDNYQKTLALCDDLKQSLLRKAFNGEL